MSEEKRDYPTTVTGMWKPKSGKNYFIIANLTPDLIAKLETIDETGMLVFKPVDKDPDTNRPDGYLEYYNAEQKEAFFGGKKDESEGI